MTYTSYADLGGLAVDAAIVAEPEGNPFHADWQARVLALTLAMGATGAWNIDMSRAARETQPDYRAKSYYEIWFGGLLKLLAQRGLVSDDEISSGAVHHSAPALPRRLLAADVAAVLAKGTPTTRAVDHAARFSIGQRVRTRAARVGHHTRLPGYAHDKFGVIEKQHGAHVFADASAQGLGEQPHYLYTVVFDALELWGPTAPAPLSRVSIDAWEPYLDAA